MTNKQTQKYTYWLRSTRQVKGGNFIINEYIYLPRI